MGVICGNNRKVIQIEEYEIDSRKKGSLRIIRDKTGRLVYSRRDEIIVTETIQDILNNFFIEPDELDKLWEFFKKVDHTKSGYIMLKELYLVINQNPSMSIVGPILDRFFNLIEKEFKDKVTFEEFIPNLLSYCLYSNFQLKEFMFSIFDLNHDHYINRNDIVKFFSIKKNDKKIFFSNYLDSINNYPHLVRSDKITFEEFLEICQDLHFIHYPAEKLQKLFKENILGEKFWKKLHKKISDSYKQHLYVNNKKMKDKLDEIKLNEKIENYKKNLLTRKFSYIVYQKEARMDKFKRRLSDTNFYLSKNLYTKDDVKSLDNINLINI
jgi:Ca2+-binding EF-hand superfamily protein